MSCFFYKAKIFTCHIEKAVFNDQKLIGSDYPPEVEESKQSNLKDRENPTGTIYRLKVKYLIDIPIVTT